MVPGDRIKPGGKLRSSPEGTHALKRLDEDFLGEIDGRVRIPGHVVAPGSNSAMVTLEQNIEEWLARARCIRSLATLDQFLVCQLLHSMRSYLLRRIFRVSGTKNEGSFWRQ